MSKKFIPKIVSDELIPPIVEHIKEVDNSSFIEVEKSISSANDDEGPLVWKNSEGRLFSEKHVFDWVSKTKFDKENEYQITVGTDSQILGYRVRFITVICVYKVGKGGNYYYLETYEPRDNYISPNLRGKKAKGNQKMRMFNEVEKSIVIADSLFEKTEVLSIIHIDASSSNLTEFTSEFSDQLIGFAKGAGYQAFCKPTATTSSVIADRHSK